MRDATNRANQITAANAGWCRVSLSRKPSGFRICERIASWGHAPSRGSRHWPGAAEFCPQFVS